MSALGPKADVGLVPIADPLFEVAQSSVAKYMVKATRTAKPGTFPCYAGNNSLLVLENSLFS